MGQECGGGYIKGCALEAFLCFKYFYSIYLMVFHIKIIIILADSLSHPEKTEHVIMSTSESRSCGNPSFSQSLSSFPQPTTHEAIKVGLY